MTGWMAQPWVGAAAGAIVTGLFLLLAQRYARRGQKEKDSGELALEIAKETRAEVKELRLENAWAMGAVTSYQDHLDTMWTWIAGGQPPPPPPRRPTLAPRPGLAA